MHILLFINMGSHHVKFQGLQIQLLFFFINLSNIKVNN